VGGNVVFTPTANFNGPAALPTVRTTAAAQRLRRVDVTVTTVNDAPVANPDAASAPIDTPLLKINVLGNDTGTEAIHSR
jgi:hypothetical protein